jgi:hypothetical protein
VQWRFRYDKYKPLKNPATCQQCKQKTVVKAYRTLCDGCAQRRNVCPACCDPMPTAEEDAAAVAAIAAARKPGTVAAAAAAAAAAEGDDEDEDVVETDGVVWGQAVDDGEIVSKRDQCSQQPDDDDDDDDNQLDEEVELGMDVAWNEKKFANIANSKYSKNRATGFEESTYQY